ncbi:sensor domain-containing diguanylate cyclase [Motiliproteus coralliicola]|uniref:sensor domain-containing diguanylate cyclase n=1 Tax=Motiliproteus coralliicola TaxID=2283196 RepID=UPI001402DBED|nr:diguanylate cyclase [Motiliproteus coralliicola]
MPVLFLTYWVQNSALEKEVNAVNEKHLLLAQNLTGALSRYVTDVSESFRLSTNVLNEHPDLPRHLAELLSSMDIRVVAELKPGAKSVQPILGKQDRLPANPAKILESELNRAADAGPDSILFSGIKRNAEGDPMLYLLRQRADGEGCFIAGLATDFIIEVQEKVSFGRKGHAAIVDADGLVLAHPKPDWRLAMKDISKVSAVQLMMAGETGVTTFHSPAMKADMIAGYATVPDVGWGVMIPQPYQELVDKAGDVRFIALAISSLGVTVAALISWWLAGLIAGPIKEVIESAQKLSQGEANQVSENEVAGAKELKQLAISFNRMAKDVLSARKNLEHKVAERTRELTDEISQRVIIENKIRHLASHDDLTGVANRTLLMDRLQMRLADSRRRDEQAALLFLDLDRFKPVNDRLGHSIGDLLLKAVAERLTEATREADTVARYGGDEFVIVLGPYEKLEHVEGFATKILQSLQQPFQIESHLLSIGASIGIAVADTQTNTPESLLHKADHAMYKAKQAGRNRIAFAGRDYPGLSPTQAAVENPEEPDSER